MSSNTNRTKNHGCIHSPVWGWRGHFLRLGQLESPTYVSCSYVPAGIPLSICCTLVFFSLPLHPNLHWYHSSVLISLLNPSSPLFFFLGLFFRSGIKAVDVCKCSIIKIHIVRASVSALIWSENLDDAAPAIGDYTMKELDPGFMLLSYWVCCLLEIRRWVYSMLLE